MSRQIITKDCVFGVVTKNCRAALEHFEKFMIKGRDEIAAKRSKEGLSEMKRVRQLVGTIHFTDVPATKGMWSR